MPKVCVLLPVYNAEAHLGLALASLCHQSHRDLEIIAIDDGSTDRSGDILEAAAAEDRRIRAIRRPNAGLTPTLNEALSLADADHVARMDADDISYPDRIARQVAAFAQDDRLGLLGCNFDTILQDGGVLPPPPDNPFGNEERAVFGRFSTSLRHPTVMLRRSRLPGGVLHYDPAYPCAEDFDLFRRCAEVAPISETVAPHLAYRLHDQSVSVRRVDTMARSHLQILEENLQRHYPFAAGTGVVALPDRLDGDTAGAAAALVLRLLEHRERQPGHERAGYERGLTNMFYFLFALFCRKGRYDLARDYVDRAGQWGLIRRRERLLLNVVPPLAGLRRAGFALSERAVARRTEKRAVPIGDRVPGLSTLAASAARWTAAARAEALSDAA